MICIGLDHLICFILNIISFTKQKTFEYYRKTREMFISTSMVICGIALLWYYINEIVFCPISPIMIWILIHVIIKCIFMAVNIVLVILIKCVVWTESKVGAKETHPDIENILS